MGGGPIVGVGINVPKPSLIAYKKQTHYNQWQFIYDPNQDLAGLNGQTGVGAPQQPGGAAGGIPGASPAGGAAGGAPSGMMSPNGFGDSSGFGGGAGFGSTPASPQAPASPQPSTQP